MPGPLSLAGLRPPSFLLYLLFSPLLSLPISLASLERIEKFNYFNHLSTFWRRVATHFSQLVRQTVLPAQILLPQHRPALCGHSCRATCPSIRGRTWECPPFIFWKQLKAWPTVTVEGKMNGSFRFLASHRKGSSYSCIHLGYLFGWSSSPWPACQQGLWS